MLKLSENLDLPIDFVTERIAFLARTGAGKSGGMRVLFEQMFDAGQFCVFIDPKGDAWGIRAAGHKAGKAVLVMGGDHADVPLEATAGKYIAEFLVRERVSTVLDISDFGKADMVRFITDLASTLYRRNRDVLHVFIDEADMVAGEKFYDPRCLEAIQLIQNKGRHRGFGVTIATQRSAMINKSVLYASGTLVAMQTTAPRDIKTIKEWLDIAGTPEVTREIVGALPQLKTREALVYSPQVLGSEPVRIKFAEFQTFDSMRTPRPGETRQTPKSLADIDLSAIQRDMAETIEKVKADDPKVLRKQIGDLQKEINALRISVNSEVKEVEIVKQVFPKDALIELSQLASSMIDGSQLLSKLDDLQVDIRVRLNKLLDSLNEMPPSSGGPKHATAIQNVPGPAPKPVNTTSQSGRTSVPISGSSPPPKKSQNMTISMTGKVSGPQKKLLDTLRLFESFGSNEVKRSNLAAFAGVSPRSSGFEKNLSTLRNNPEGSLVDYLPGSMVKLTDSGRAIADEPDGRFTTSRDLLEAWCRQISNPQGVLLRILFDLYPEPMTRDDLATCAEVSVNSSGFEKNLSTMRSLGLVDYGPNRTVFATDLLFPTGLN